MLTVENVLYFRLVLLLTRAGCGVLRQHVAKCFQKEIDFPLHNFLHMKKETITQRLCTKQLLLMFPHSSELPDLLKWDISLLCYLILDLLEIQQSSNTVYKAVKTIRDIRNEVLGHFANPSISVRTYNEKWDELKKAIEYLSSSSSFTETEKNNINELIQSAAEANFNTRTVIEEISEDNPSEDFLEHIDKQIRQKYHSDLLKIQQDISEIKTKMENGGQSTVVVNTVLGQVKLTSLDKKVTDSAAKCLLQATEYSIKKDTIAKPTSDLQVKVDSFYQDIENTGVKVLNFEEGSVILTFKCSTMNSLLDLIEYFNVPLIQSRLDAIGKVLGDMFGEELTIEAVLDLEDLQDVVKRFSYPGEEMHNSVHVSRRYHGDLQGAWQGLKCVSLN